MTLGLAPTAPSGMEHRARVRIEVVDWLRGLAVVFMILAHGCDAWLLPSAKTGIAYEIIRLASGIPARLFLLLVGVSAAIQFESGLKKGLPAKVMRRNLIVRGCQILGLAYLFRLQEWLLANFYGGWETLFRVDILNAIGASMVLVALLATPRDGKRKFILPLLGAAFFLALGTTLGPAVFPSFLPRPLTSYFGGQRPMAWFSLFPWGAWSLLGVPLGYFWVYIHQRPEHLSRTFLATAFAGACLVLTVTVVRLIDPTIIRYPSAVIMQMGPGIFFHRLGIILILAGIGYLTCRSFGASFSVLRQLGRTSLLIYWVHIELCYGQWVQSLRERLTIPAALFFVAVLTALMLGLSILKTRYLPTLLSRLKTHWGNLTSTSHSS